MDDATQNLVDEARRQAHILIRTGHGVEGRTLYERLADALEAAQRPPVSPEMREEVRAVVGEQLTKAGLNLDGPPYSDDGETQWPVALQLRDCLTNALLARFAVPERTPVSPEQREALDELITDVLIAERDEWPRDPGDAPSEVLAGAVTDALLARFSLPKPGGSGS